MNRRIFLKLLGLSPIVPSVLCAKEKIRKEKEDILGITELKQNEYQWHEHEDGEWHIRHEYRNYDFYSKSPLAETMEFIKGAKLGILCV